MNAHRAQTPLVVFGPQGSDEVNHSQLPLGSEQEQPGPRLQIQLQSPLNDKALRDPDMELAESQSSQKRAGPTLESPPKKSTVASGGPGIRGNRASRGRGGASRGGRGRGGRGGSVATRSASPPFPLSPPLQNQQLLPSSLDQMRAKDLEYRAHNVAEESLVVAMAQDCHRQSLAASTVRQYDRNQSHYYVSKLHVLVGGCKQLAWANFFLAMV